MARIRGGATEKALYDVTDALRYAPLDANLYVVRAVAKLRLGWTLAARDDAARALVLRPGLASAESVQLAATQAIERQAQAATTAPPAR